MVENSSNHRRTIQIASHVAAFAWLSTVLFFAPPSHAGSTYPVITKADSGVKLEVTSWLTSAPPSGMFPVRVKSTNNTDTDLAWSLQSREQTTNGNGASTFSQSFAATASHNSETELYLPILADPSSTTSGYYKYINLSASGPAVERPQVATLSANPNGSSSGSTSSRIFTPLIGLDASLSNTPIKTFNARVAKRSLLGEELDMLTAPRDWRGYTALAQLWITEGKLASISAEQRAAMLDWVSTGGRLYVKSDNADTIASTLQLPPANESTWHHGFGQIQVISAPPDLRADKSVGTAIDFTVIAGAKIRDAENHATATFLKGYQDHAWKLRDLAGELVINGKLIFGFILIFGIIVGPINLFVLAPVARRQRLFWTTPLISLAGSGLLIALMLLQDGIGGTGARLTLAVIEPNTKRMAIIQEQASRTGVLLSRSIPKTEPVWMLPLKQDTSSTGTGTSTSFGIRTTRTTRVNSSDANYNETATSYDGSWFSSRATQAQLLITVRPSREAIELTPGATASDAPSIVSSIGNGLKTIYVMDDKQQLWMAENVGTGERVTLNKTNFKDLLAWRNTSTDASSSDLFKQRLQDALYHQTHDPNNGTTLATPKASWFLAEVEQPDKLAIPTLASIRWTDDHAFIAGPWVKK